MARGITGSEKAVYEYYCSMQTVVWRKSNNCVVAASDLRGEGLAMVK